MKPSLDRWIIFGNCLVGNIYDAKGFAPGTRVKTDAIVEVDVAASMARCVDGDYLLKDPGENWEHQVPNDIKIYDPSTAREVKEKKIIIGV